MSKKDIENGMKCDKYQNSSNQNTSLDCVVLENKLHKALIANEEYVRFLNQLIAHSEFDCVHCKNEDIVEGCNMNCGEGFMEWQRKEWNKENG